METRVFEYSMTTTTTIKNKSFLLPSVFLFCQTLKIVSQILLRK